MSFGRKRTPLSSTISFLSGAFCVPHPQWLAEPTDDACVKSSNAIPLMHMTHMCSVEHRTIGNPQQVPNMSRLSSTFT